jgi:Domain of unknown function (DUF892)
MAPNCGRTYRALRARSLGTRAPARRSCDGDPHVVAGGSMTTSPRDNLIAWLSDAYAMEGQAIQLLERQIGRLEHYPEMRRKLEEHLGQTRGQQAALE